WTTQARDRAPPSSRTRSGCRRAPQTSRRGIASFPPAGAADPLTVDATPDRIGVAWRAGAHVPGAHTRPPRLVRISQVVGTRTPRAPAAAGGAAEVAAASRIVPITTSKATPIQPKRPGFPSIQTPRRRPAAAPSQISPNIVSRLRLVYGETA